jgi:hypothetical protein
VSFQFSPDGRWWWDGSQWQPAETLSAPMHPAYAMSEPPGTIRGAMWIGIIGALLVGVLGLIISVVGAALGNNPDFQQGLQQGLSRSGSTIDPGQLTTVLAFIGIALVAFGVIWAGVNYALMYFMNQRHAWAWVVALILIGLGTVLDLVQAVHNPVALVHVLLIQLPMATLLLLTPTRRWVGIG